MHRILCVFLIALSACKSPIYSDDNSGLEQQIAISPTGTGWNILRVDSSGTEHRQTTVLSKTFTPQSTKDCPGGDENAIIIKTAETVELVVTGGAEPRRLCIPELDVDLEVYPGLMQSQIIQATTPRRVCGVCQTSDGGYDLSSAIIIDIKDD